MQKIDSKIFLTWIVITLLITSFTPKISLCAILSPNPIVNRAVPFPAKGPTTITNLLGIPVVETPDNTKDAENGVFPGKGWRVINTGTLPLFLDRLPYIDTPHQEWAKPYRGGKLKVLYINSTYEIGEATMLEQRGDLECTIYCIPVYLDWYGNWPADKTFTSFLERRMKVLLGYNPDVIIANGPMAGGGQTSEGSTSLLPRIHELVLEKVKSGAGLILIPNDSTKTYPDGQDVFSKASPLRYIRYGGGQNTFSGTHPIVEGVPLDLLGLSYSMNSEPMPGAEVPIKSGNLPFLATSNYGAGRVVAFGYCGKRSIPDHPGDNGDNYLEKTERRLQDDAYHWYEYGYSMLIKAILWAAKKDPRIGVQVEKTKTIQQGDPVRIALTITKQDDVDNKELPLVLDTTVRNSDYATVKQLSTPVTVQPGEKTTVNLELGNEFRKGLHLVDILLKNQEGQVENWASVPLIINSALTLTVKTDKDYYQPGDKVRVSTLLEPVASGVLSLRTELWDSYGRLMYEKARAISSSQRIFSDVVEFPLTSAVAKVFEIRTLVFRNQLCLEKRTDEISIPHYEYGDEWRNKMWSVANPQTDPLYKAIGIDDMTGATYPHRLGSIRLNARGNFGSHPWSTGPHPSNFYPKGPTDDQHHPSVLDPTWRDQEEKNIAQAAKTVSRYGLTALSLTGEFVCEYDSSYDPLTLKAFNAYLREKYQALDALNAQWETNYKDWAEVGPIKTEDWKKKKTKNFSQWMEFRRFIDRILTDAHVRTADTWRRELKAPIRVGQEQTFGLWQATIPYGGFDYYGMLSRGLNCWTSYAGGDSGMFYRPIPYHTEFEWLLLTSHCKGPIRGIGGWTSGGLEGWTSCDGRSWSVLFNGGAGMDWYEPSMFLAGYGALLPAGAAIHRSTHEIKSGIDKALLSAQRHTDPIAVWQDMTNEYAAWLLTGCTSFSRWDVIRNFNVHHLKPQIVSSDQIESGDLTIKGIKLLYLPHIVCVSEKAALQIKKFVEKGGVVVADYGAGAFDELGKPLPHGYLDELFGISRMELKKEQGNSTVVIHENDSKFALSLKQYPAAYDNPYWEGNLRVTTGKALGTVGKPNPAPAFIINHVGQGHTLLLNFFPEGFARAPTKASDKRESCYQLGSALMKLAGIVPEIQVKASDKPLKYFDVNRFQRGSAWYLGVLRYPDLKGQGVGYVGGVDDALRYLAESSPEPDAFTIDLPVTGHIYELRSHRYLGKGKQINDTLKVGDIQDAVRVYGILPYAVRGIDLQMPSSAARGKVLNYSVSVTGADGTADHVLRIEVINPEGRLPEAYQQKVLALRGRYYGRLPIAMNDPTGTWVLKVMDVISGKEAAKAFELR